MRMKLARLFPALAVVGLFVTACGGGGGGGGTTAVTVPSDLSVSSFDANFTYMSKLNAMVAANHSLVGVILPDTTTSTRYITYDLPYLKRPFDTPGYPSSQNTTLT